jgi:glutamyl-tRNA synthetase
MSAVITPVVRTCPSPTGTLHIGTIRTALFNFLFAKKQNGKILFRSEDTDKERSKKEYEEDIVSGLFTLGLLEKDTPLIRQSERTEIYAQYLQQLLEEGKAYYCFMTSEELLKERELAEKNKKPFLYSGKYRDFPKEEAEKRIQNGEKAVIRFKMPKNTELRFTDSIYGEKVFHSSHFDDFVLAKDVNTPLYNFCVVVDDHDMGVTHVLRGEDHMSNTPKQIALYQAFGWETPQFGHFPLIINADKTKLSKRKNKTAFQEYLNEGFLKEAIVNYLALLGWNPGTEQEMFSLSELIENFSLERVQKSPAVYDMKKLEWLNAQYIKNLSFKEFENRISPFVNEDFLPFFEKDEKKSFFLPLVQDKIRLLSEINENISYLYLYTPPSLDLVLNEKMKVSEEIAKQSLQESLHIFQSMTEESFTFENISQKLLEKTQELSLKNGQMLWPLRAVLTGKTASFGAFEVAYILGKQETEKRINDFLVSQKFL